MDITDALAPTSDQLDAIELVVPRTFTIAEGSRLGNRDGKTVAEIRLVDFPRVWRPSKGMLDVLAKCWGIDGKGWVGHRVTLYNDPDVTFGADKVGGVRISHLSHISAATTVQIRGRGQGGRKIPWKVEPLPDAPPAQTSKITPLDGLIAAFGVAGIAKGDRLAYCIDVIGRQISSAADLTPAEVADVIARLEGLPDAAQDVLIPEPGEDQ